MPISGSRHTIYALGVAFLAALFVLPQARGQEDDVPYAEPDFERQLFLREALLLESQEISEIVTALAALASNFSHDEKITNRLRAKALAIALTLDGIDPNAVQANRALKGGDLPAKVTGFSTLPKIARTIWDTAGYLESPEKGRNEQILQYCLADIAREIDPENQRDSRRFPLTIAKNLFGGWDVILGKRPGPEIDFPPVEGATDPEKPEPIPDLENLGGTKEAEGKIRSIVPEGRKSRISEIHGDLSLRSGNAPLAVVFTDSDGDTEQPLNEQRAGIVSALTETHDGQWPTNSGVVVLRVESGSKGDPSLTLPAAILTDALIRGREVHADTLAIGIVSPDGSLALAGRLRQRLRSLDTSDAIIIVPGDNVPELQDMLLLREFDAFFNHQIITAATLGDAIEIASGERSKEFGQGLALFGQIQGLLGGNTPEQLSESGTVKSRLEQIVKLNPDHASASLLLKNANGELPKTLTLGGSMVALARASQPVVEGMQERKKSGILSDPSIAKTARARLGEIVDLMHADVAEICVAMVDLTDKISEHVALDSKKGDAAVALRAEIESAWEVVRSEFQQLKKNAG